jgi:hypothetical protein
MTYYSWSGPPKLFRINGDPDSKVLRVLGYVNALKPPDRDTEIILRLSLCYLQPILIVLARRKCEPADTAIGHSENAPPTTLEVGIDDLQPPA